MWPVASEFRTTYVQHSLVSRAATCGTVRWWSIASIVWSRSRQHFFSFSLFPLTTTTRRGERDCGGRQTGGLGEWFTLNVHMADGGGGRRCYADKCTHVQCAVQNGSAQFFNLSMRTTFSLNGNKSLDRGAVHCVGG